MSIDAKQLRDYVIIPALEEIDAYSEAAVNLLLGTAAQESAMGKYLAQVPSGIAKGVFQMEGATHADIWENYLAYQDELKEKVLRSCISNNPKTLVYNLKYAAIMCRVHYLRVPEALPDKDDIVGLAEYWKLKYNTVYGAGTIDEFMENWQRYAAKAAL